MLVALELQNGVHNVLQHFRSGERTFLGYVPDNDKRRVGLLGKLQDTCGALPHLRQRADGCLYCLRADSLDRIHNDDIGF